MSLAVRHVEPRIVGVQIIQFKPKQLAIYDCNRSIYLFINYNTITNYILIIYELSNFDHVLCVVSQTRISGGNRTHHPHANGLARYPLDYPGTHHQSFHHVSFSRKKGVKTPKNSVVGHL